MIHPRTDSNDYGPQNNDSERDLGSKGGPGSGPGIPDNKHGISKPYDEDLQTQIAAKGKGKKKKEKKIKE
jgi:hypothetical protein